MADDGRRLPWAASRSLVGQSTRRLKLADKRGHARTRLASVDPVGFYRKESIFFGTTSGSSVEEHPEAVTTKSRSCPARHVRTGAPWHPDTASCPRVSAFVREFQPRAHARLRPCPRTNRSIKSTVRNLVSDAGRVPTTREAVLARCDDDAKSSTFATSRRS